MDNTIIEHLACVEINECILKPPFHLVSNVQWNDKGLSFDGDISLYSNQIKKEDFVGIVPIQIKGTTSNKKTSKRNKIKHPVTKEDLEVYYKNGNGVLYFVVTINPNTYIRQAYYNILAPLDLKDLLIKLEANGNQSITIPFKKLESGSLEIICKQFLRTVEKQPKIYIEAGLDKKFEEYRIDYIRLQEETSFDLFEEPAYLYGVNEGIEIPLRTAKLQEVRTVLNEEVKIEDEEFNVKYEVRESEDRRYLLIEDSLIVEIIKETNKGKITLSKVKKLSSYLKCLKILKFLRDYNELPFTSSEFVATLDKKEDFSDVEDDIKVYKDIIGIFNQIGISGNYTLDDHENISELFNGLLSLFKQKQYQMLTYSENIDFENSLVQVIKLSKYIKVMVLFNKENNEYTDFFSEETLNKVAGLLPKREIKKYESEDIENDYWRVSIYSSQKLKIMHECANFKLDVIKKSFANKYHDVNSPNTINTALDYLNYFDLENDARYIEIAEDLISRYLKINPHDILGKINKYQINIRKFEGLSEKETDEVLDILEEAERENNKSICFACEVLLKNRSKAKRLFDTLDDEEQKSLIPYPIYNLFQGLKQ
ncbi:DUF4365 domain-containing protein [Radiobacillus deserti]|uniref:DUF4365 domain-containing protein n=1 Tax=Radiobacillus deserti TaxID=2594883 RepID=A0A516KDH7_9BACI|nr:DUF4365 domain-containing protein [Radiobacillus deserti]QDP39458.1 DUF4365 domain-containing protein [Radiobacillus deserti]